MIYGMRLFAEAKAEELAKANRSTFSVYKLPSGQYEVVNGVDASRENSMVARYQVWPLVAARQVF